MTQVQVILTAVMIGGLSLAMFGMGMFVGYQIGRAKGALEITNSIMAKQLAKIKGNTP